MHKSAFDEGCDAALVGKSETSNPYPIRTVEHLDWNDGFHKIEDEEDDEDLLEDDEDLLEDDDDLLEEDDDFLDEEDEELIFEDDDEFD